MSDMDLYEIMGTQLAIRRLRPDPIPEDVLGRIFKAATLAPTGGNRQAWRMIAVRDPALKAQLGALYKKQWLPFTDNYRKMGEGSSDEAAAAMSGRIGEMVHPERKPTCQLLAVAAISHSTKGRYSWARTG